MSDEKHVDQRWRHKYDRQHNPPDPTAPPHGNKPVHEKPKPVSRPVKSDPKVTKEDDNG